MQFSHVSSSYENSPTPIDVKVSCFSDNQQPTPVLQMSADQIGQNEYEAAQIDELRLKPMKTRSSLKKSKQTRIKM